MPRVVLSFGVAVRAKMAKRQNKWQNKKNALNFQMMICFQYVLVSLGWHIETKTYLTTMKLKKWTSKYGFKMFCFLNIETGWKLIYFCDIPSYFHNMLKKITLCTNILMLITQIHFVMLNNISKPKNIYKYMYKSSWKYLQIYLFITLWVKSPLFCWF